MSLLSAVQLTGGYTKAPVLRDFDLEVSAGEIVAVFGANGAGKTTLLRALGGALMAAPKVMLIDEMSAGLAPVITERLVEGLARIRERGVAVVLVEQAPQLVADIVDRAYLVEQGRVVGSGRLDELGGP